MSEMNKSFLDTIKATNLCTLKEYIYVYPRLLTEFQKLGDDNNEMSFIKEQIKQHSIHIEIQKDAQKNLLDDGYKDKYGTFEDYILIVRSFDIRIISLKAIIKFLRQKKQELKTPPDNNSNELKEDEQDDTENIFLSSKIEEFLKPFKNLISDKDYTILTNSLKTYFNTKSFPILNRIITINGRPNKKAFGWALNRIFESQSKGVELPLLYFCKNNISLFKDYDFEEETYLKSNLYSYLTTNTKYSPKITQ